MQSYYDSYQSSKNQKSKWNFGDSLCLVLLSVKILKSTNMSMVHEEDKRETRSQELLV